jgi:hypothetical protein
MKLQVKEDEHESKPHASLLFAAQEQRVGATVIVNIDHLLVAPTRFVAVYKWWWVNVQPRVEKAEDGFACVESRGVQASNHTGEERAGGGSAVCDRDVACSARTRAVSAALTLGTLRDRWLTRQTG